MSVLTALSSDILIARAGGLSVRTAGSGKPKLTQDQQKQVDELKKRDTEVRQHEAAHLSAAGPYATSGPVYDYQVGPDGKQYAVGGHVDIDTSPVPGDPEATIRKAAVVQQAALAPADPSAEDRQVAVQAAKMASQARAALARSGSRLSARANGAAKSYLQTIGDSPEGSRVDLTA